MCEEDASSLGKAIGPLALSARRLDRTFIPLMEPENTGLPIHRPLSIKERSDLNLFTPHGHTQSVWSPNYGSTFSHWGWLLRMCMQVIESQLCWMPQQTMSGLWPDSFFLSVGLVWFVFRGQAWGFFFFSPSGDSPDWQVWKCLWLARQLWGVAYILELPYGIGWSQLSVGLSLPEITPLLDLLLLSSGFPYSLIVFSWKPSSLDPLDMNPYLQFCF